MHVAVAVAVSLGLNTAILVLLQKRYDRELYRLVLISYSLTIVLRYLLAVYLWLNHMDPGFSRTFWGDSQTYDYLGAAVAEGWSQASSSAAWMETLEGKANRGFIYFVASIYYVFGRNILLVQFLNGIIGTLTSICILEIGILLYGRRVGVFAMLFTAFFPQMIFWSCALYKDPAIMLCIAASMLATLHLARKFQLHWLFAYLAAVTTLLWLRFYIFYVIVAATMIGFLVSQKRGPVFALASQLVMVAAITLLLFLTPVGREALAQQQYFSFQQLQNSRTDLARAGSGFAREANVSTPMAAIRILPLGVTYLLFSPFPWAVSNLRQLLALPDVLVWYLMVPYLIRGLYLAVRHRLGQTMPILIFTTSLTLAYGIFQGNAGTAYRQRTQIMMFYFLFVADGLIRKRVPAESPGELGLSNSEGSPVVP